LAAVTVLPFKPRDYRLYEKKQTAPGQEAIVPGIGVFRRRRRAVSGLGDIQIRSRSPTSKPTR
jgi:hypothetical protein